jgi:hypothetical protein
MAHVNSIPQIQLLDELGEIVRVGVKIVPLPRLA